MIQSALYKIYIKYKLPIPCLNLNIYVLLCDTFSNKPLSSGGGVRNELIIYTRVWMDFKSSK